MPRAAILNRGAAGIAKVTAKAAPALFQVKRFTRPMGRALARPLRRAEGVRSMSRGVAHAL